MEIPASSLSKEALRRVAEEVVTREGTFYGDGPEPDLNAQVDALLSALARNEAVLIYDAQTESCTIRRRDE